MQEIERIWLKYEQGRFLARIESLDEVNRLALTFGNDVAQTFPCSRCCATQIETLPDTGFPTRPSSVC